jgi:hypothetical protein
MPGHLPRTPRLGYGGAMVYLLKRALDPPWTRWLPGEEPDESR